MKLSAAGPGTARKNLPDRQCDPNVTAALAGRPSSCTSGRAETLLRLGARS